jgi:5'-nucleotidase
VRKQRTFVAGAALLVALAAATAASVAQATPSGRASAPAESVEGPTSLSGMRILLVNDDSIQATSPTGRDGLGLYALRKSLCEAGADVLTVGPWAVQSGMGGRITLSGSATVQEVAGPAAYAEDCAGAPSGGRVFGVCTVAGTCAPDSPSASPADAARIAITRFLPDNYWPGGPDLVVSGINFGQNDSLSLIHSGTVNAATVAYHLGLPAIAFSEELVVPCLRGETATCPEFTGTAAFGAELVAELAEDGLITQHLFLNVNYPHLDDGEQVGEPVFNVLGECGALNFGFNGEVGADGGTYAAGIIAPCEEPRRNADTTALANDQISIVPLDGDSTDTLPDRRVANVVRDLGR